MVCWRHYGDARRRFFHLRDAVSTSANAGARKASSINAIVVSDIGQSDKPGLRGVAALPRLSLHARSDLQAWPPLEAGDSATLGEVGSFPPAGVAVLSRRQAPDSSGCFGFQLFRS